MPFYYSYLGFEFKDLQRHIRSQNRLKNRMSDDNDDSQESSV